MKNPAESRYEILVKITTLLEITIDALPGYVNVEVAAERFKDYIEKSSYFKVEIVFDKNGIERYAIFLKNVSVRDNGINLRKNIITFPKRGGHYRMNPIEKILIQIQSERQYRCKFNAKENIKISAF